MKTMCTEFEWSAIGGESSTINAQSPFVRKIQTEFETVFGKRWTDAGRLKGIFIPHYYLPTTHRVTDNQSWVAYFPSPAPTLTPDDGRLVLR